MTSLPLLDKTSLLLSKRASKKASFACFFKGLSIKKFVQVLAYKKIKFFY
jgi:hypothetical protein